MLNARGAILAALASLLVASTVEAQETRSELIAQSQGQEEAARMAFLYTASDPGLAPLDSVWAVAVHELSTTLVALGEEEAASVWLRLAARFGAEWPVNRLIMRPRVVEAYDEALDAVGSEISDGDESVSTTWRWGTGFDRAAQGTLEIESVDPSLAVSVEVVGEASVSTPASLALAPGTYEVVVSSPDYEAVRVHREVLPGATTVVGLDLLPLMPAGVEQQVEGRLVRIDLPPGGAQVCTNGYLFAEDGVVLTALDGLRGAEQVTVTTSDGSVASASVGTVDPASNLAVLRVEELSADSSPDAQGVQDRQFVWSVFRDGCAAPSSERTRLAGWTDPPPDRVGVDPGLSAAAAGAPVVDRSGALVGLMTESDSMVPALLARQLISRAIAELVAGEDQVAAGGGGGPWKWVAGVGAAGALGAFLLSGGGDDGGGGGPATTGKIVITFPGG